MAENKSKATPPSEEQLKSEIGTAKNLQSDPDLSSLEARESAVLEREAAVLLKETVLSEVETAISERESAVSERESAVLLKDSAITERETAVSQREADIEEREKNFNPIKPEEAVKGLEFEFQDEKFKFKDSAPKALRFDGSVMTQSQMIEDEDIILDLVSSNSIYIAKL